MFITNATNLPRVMACNGSRLMQPSFPKTIDDDTTVRDEGNAAHFMALSAFNGVHTVEELIDRKAPNGIYMTPEMAEHVQSYLNHVEGRGNMEVVTTFEGPTWRVDARADYIWFNQNVLEHDADGVVISEPGTLHIDDFKYGWRLVEPEMNWTLIAHAVGYCSTRQVTPTRIKFTIHQPRPHHFDGPVRSWSITWAELLKLYEQINMTMSNPTDELRTGPQCAKCHALATCPAARAASLNSIDTSEMAFNEDVDNSVLAFSIDQLQRAKTMIETRLKASEELAMHRLRSGQIIDDFGVEMQYTNTRWKSHITVDMMKIITGKNLAKPALITPKQAIKAGVAETIVAPLTERVPTGMKLIRGSAHKRATRILGPKS